MKSPFLNFAGFIGSAHAVGFPGAIPPQNAENVKLSAQSFPTTTDDLSFTERAAIMAEGYAPFETVWDSSGRCISGCAYSGMSVDSEIDRLKRDTAIVQQKIAIHCAENPEICAPPPAPEDEAQKTGPAAPAPLASRGCSQFNPGVSPSQTIPLGMPLTGAPKITSHFQPARRSPVDGNVRDHNGVDFAANVGTPIFSPARGTVDRVFQDSACGKGLIVRHSDGFATGYCHLSDNGMVQKGAVVGAGCMIARTGNTGRSTGPHLHYMVYLNKRFVPPENFISRR